MSTRDFSPAVRRAPKAPAGDLTTLLSQAAHAGPAAVAVTNGRGEIEYVNRRFTALTGYAAREVLGRPASLLKSGEMPQARYRALWRALRRGETWSGEFHNRKKDGTLYWEQASISPIRDAGGRVLRYLKVALDISAQKRLESDLRASVQALRAHEKQLAAANRQLAAATRALRRSHEQLQRQSQQDALTGLLNRRGFASELQRLRASAERSGRPVGILILDIDHFKQLNDRYGHAAGDEILQALTNLLRRQLRASDLVCRYGGDELVIALPDADETAVRHAGQRILEAVRRRAFSPSRGGLSVTVSIGAACGLPAPGQSLDAVLKLADRALYRVKRGTRNGLAFAAEEDAQGNASASVCGTRHRPIFDLLLAAIEARDRATAAHCQRVAVLAGALAEALRLPAIQIEQVVHGALLHDIGKLTVPDAVLLKPAPLTDGERAIVQRHAQAGHDILAHCPELSGLAELVRNHHERLDGSGYPRGLKGRQIDLPARILAVADTYDAICVARPYSTPRSASSALRELRRCSGSLFDAAVVKALPRALRRAAAPGLSAPDGRSPRGRGPSGRATRA